MLFPRIGVRKVAAIESSLLYYFYWKHPYIPSGPREHSKKARPRRSRRLTKSRPLLSLSSGHFLLTDEHRAQTEEG